MDNEIKRGSEIQRKRRNIRKQQRKNCLKKQQSSKSSENKVVQFK